MDDSEQKQKPRPARYKLYDKLKLRVSLKAMDILIYAVVALIVIALIAGILMD